MPNFDVILIGYDLQGYVDNIFPCPVASNFLGTEVISPAITTQHWIRWDKLIIYTIFTGEHECQLQ